MPRMRLLRAYFNRPTLMVARSLIGKYLVRSIGGREIAGKIIEVEAYIGPRDKACHASKGKTQRTEVMFGPSGRAYVYLIYGMYHCLNVVTEREEYPGAVLIRAIEVDGVLIDGPGRLCRAMQIDRSLNRIEEAGSCAGRLPRSRESASTMPVFGRRSPGDFDCTGRRMRGRGEARSRCRRGAEPVQEFGDGGKRKRGRRSDTTAPFRDALKVRLLDLAIGANLGGGGHRRRNLNLWSLHVRETASALSLGDPGIVGLGQILLAVLDGIG
jgi:DNA-3-methyladenine glycosylase